MNFARSAFGVKLQEGAAGVTHPSYKFPNHSHCRQPFVIANRDSMLDKCAARL
jgi:hypothetical protein